MVIQGWSEAPQHSQFLPQDKQSSFSGQEAKETMSSVTEKQGRITLRLTIQKWQQL